MKMGLNIFLDRLLIGSNSRRGLSGKKENWENILHMIKKTALWNNNHITQKNFKRKA